MAKKRTKKPAVKAAKAPAADVPHARTAGPGKKKSVRIKVQARTDLYSDDNKYHRTGDVLHIDEHHFNAKIHRRVDPSTRTKTTSSGQALRDQRRATLESRAATAGLVTDIDNPTGQDDVLGGDD